MWFDLFGYCIRIIQCVSSKQLKPIICNLASEYSKRSIKVGLILFHVSLIFAEAFAYSIDDVA